jgi:predicted metal-binding protein
MKIHRVVTMLGATTTTGRLASDMYDLNDKTYYSEAEGRDIPISHMDFQHMVRAFVKQNEATENDFSRSMKLRNHLQEENENLEMKNEKLKENLQKQEDNLLYLTSKIENMKGIIEEKDDLLDKQTANTEYWKNTYYNNQPQGCGYVFSEIPNDEYGKKLTRGMKVYLNNESYSMRVRGQHIKPELKGTGATYWGQSIEQSTHLRVYIDKKKGA